MLSSKIIVCLIAFFLLLSTGSAWLMAGTYLIARPLVQPFASLGYTLIGKIPIASLLSVILICYAFGMKLVRSNYTIITKQILPLYVLIYLSALSFVNTPDYFLSFGHCLKILTAIGLYVMLYNAVKNERDINRILWTYLFSTFIPMMYGYYQFVTETGHAWKGQYYAGRRIDSLLMEYNAYGEFLCIAMCAAMMLFFRYKKSKRRLIVGTIFISMLISLILSLNRGSWVSLYFSVIIAAMLFRRKISFFKVIGISILVLIAASPFIYQRFLELTIISEYGSANTLLGRINGWKELWPIFMKHPFLGNGIGVINITAEKNLGYSFYPHNDYLRIAAEGGSITLIGYIWFQAGNLLQNFFKEKKCLIWEINFPLTIAIVYFVFISFFQNIIYNVVVFPMFTGLLAIGHKANEMTLLKSESTIEDQDVVS